ncbi:AMP-binding protein [Deinococcus peraridilitoris]|uniref:Phenylacetate-coenzyme A ligase n=1 Tax=Deinococcus peraridilitoris (strain DSM 19664 / LMG 22246 / CIP 109416 / KR-200) TaxID=937777 RepID=L0A596_DEIPD|nr:AMP-binding protein [Deinococcus peraridilitoris]AFZ68175.1 coenzyme F390 synthetase [Deinococcus peraridilitoris DSM 19664]
MFNPTAESMPLAQLRELQLQRLQDTVARVHEKVPFYRRRLGEVGMNPGELRTLADVARLPFTRKADLRDHYPFGLLSAAREDIRRFHASSGTTGKPTVVGYDENDLEVFSEVVARSLYAAGARPGMVFHNAYGYGLFTGGLGLHGGADRLGLATVPVSGGMTERQVTLIEDFEPEIIACTPSYALVLAEALSRRGHAPGTTRLKYAILGAEPWSEGMRREIEQKLGVKATNIYGLSEIIGPGVSNEDVTEQRGSYLWEDHFYPEIVDPETGLNVADGELGVLVLTSMSRTAMPVLRYWTGDITRLLTGENSTGRSVRRMDRIQGRVDDMIILRGVNVYPSQLEAVLAQLEELTPHYQIVLTRTGLMDELQLRIESARRDASLSQEVVRRVRDSVGISISCELCEVGTVPRSEGGKLKRVLDLREAR